MKSQILQHYKDGYSSSPVEISRYKMNILIDHSCSCDSCGKSIFNLDDFPNVKMGEVLCEDCYKDKYMLTCPICEEYFYKALKPKDEIIVISKEATKEYDLGVSPGFHQILKWPYYRASCLGFDFLFADAIKLIKELDINSMLGKLYNGRKDTIWAEECCHDCMKKYTGQKKLVNNYVDREYGKKWIKFQIEVIKIGR